MWEDYKKYWKRNFAKSVGGRSGLRAWLFLFSAFVANILIILAWFAPLLMIVKFAALVDFVPAQIAAPVAISVMELIALAQLIFLSCTKRGDRLLTSVAEKIESALFPLATSEAEHALITPHLHQSFISFIPPVPTAPPRICRA